MRHANDGSILTAHLTRKLSKEEPFENRILHGTGRIH